MTPAEVHTAYAEDMGPAERAAFWSRVGFTVTFATVRAITYSIRRGAGPFHNLSLGGAHLHHHLWGIAAVSVTYGGGTAFSATPILRRLARNRGR